MLSIRFQVWRHWVAGADAGVMGSATSAQASWGRSLILTHPLDQFCAQQIDRAAQAIELNLFAIKEAARHA
jgi:hypothetical protein